MHTALQEFVRTRSRVLGSGVVMVADKQTSGKGERGGVQAGAKTISMFTPPA